MLKWEGSRMKVQLGCVAALMKFLRIPDDPDHYSCLIAITIPS
jgi:hypothetical protein